MLLKQNVEQILKLPLDWRMERARETNNKLRMHVDGDRQLLTSFLSIVNNYENEDQYAAREKFAITNQFLTEELLRPTDNAFNAKGGSKDFRFSTKQDNNKTELVSKLANVRDGMSLGEYVENVWFNKLITDPNGLIFMEIKTVKENKAPIPTYKSIHSIRAYEQNGQKVDWVIFEPHETIETNERGQKEKVNIFWAVDEVAYYKYIKKGDIITLVKEIKHDFGEVPAILCSNIIDNVTGWKRSPIQPQVELLDKYVVSNSVLSIADFMYNYPKLWEFVDDCPACDGTGSRDGSECHKCKGTTVSQDDVTKIKRLRVPGIDDKLITPPAGVVGMDTAPWELMTGSVDRTWNIIFFSHWGTSTEKDSSNETATGRFIDVQPVHNRLKKYTKSIESAHSLLADLFGKYYFPETFEAAIIQYGTRYLVETPDQIHDKYMTSKKDGAPKFDLDLLIIQYIESEFRDNETMMEYEIKKFKLEPFVHDTIEIVRASQIITLEDKARKEYYNEWCKTKSVEDIVNMDLEKLEIQLFEYTQSKFNQLNTQNEEVQ